MIPFLYELSDVELEALERLVNSTDYATLNKLFTMFKEDRTKEMIELSPESNQTDYMFQSGRVRGSILLMESFTQLSKYIDMVKQSRIQDKRKKI